MIDKTIMTQKTIEELQQDIAYYRDVIVPSMRSREAEMTRGWGNLWYQMMEENGRMCSNSLQEENSRLQHENAARIQNHIELSQYATSLEERCRTLEAIDARRSKSQWNNARFNKNTKLQY